MWRLVLATSWILYYWLRNCLAHNLSLKHKNWYCSSNPPGKFCILIPQSVFTAAACVWFLPSHGLLQLLPLSPAYFLFPCVIDMKAMINLVMILQFVKKTQTERKLTNSFLLFTVLALKKYSYTFPRRKSAIYLFTLSQEDSDLFHKMLWFKVSSIIPVAAKALNSLFL